MDLAFFNLVCELRKSQKERDHAKGRNPVRVNQLDKKIVKLEKEIDQAIINFTTPQKGLF